MPKLSTIFIILDNLGKAQILLQKCFIREQEDSTHYYELNRAKKRIEN